MAKNRNKKKKQENGSAPMDLTSPHEITNKAEAMDTSEIIVSRPPSGTRHSKVKGVQMKRSKNVRKMKSMAKAISKNEKSEEKVLKKESKTSRIQSAKKLYD